MSFWSSIKKIFSTKSVNSVYSVATSVYPIVELVCAMTPTQSDDEVVAAANKLGVDVYLNPELPTGDRWPILKGIITDEASKTVHVDPELLSLAIDIALATYKNRAATAAKV